MNSIGERIRYARKSRNLTITNLKNITGISVGNISDLENNKIMPSSNALISLSNALDVSTDWILTGNKSQSDNLINTKFIPIIKALELLSDKDLNEVEDFIKFKLYMSSNSYSFNSKNKNK